MLPRPREERVIETELLWSPSRCGRPGCRKETEILILSSDGLVARELQAMFSKLRVGMEDILTEEEYQICKHEHTAPLKRLGGEVLITATPLTECLLQTQSCWVSALPKLVHLILTTTLWGGDRPQVRTTWKSVLQKSVPLRYTYWDSGLSEATILALGMLQDTLYFRAAFQKTQSDVISSMAWAKPLSADGELGHLPRLGAHSRYFNARF